MILYKYLPSCYVKNVLEKGELLFRNLTYFRQYECEKRGDPLEGHHRDNPDDDIVIDNLSSGKKIKGDFSCINSTNSDLIYVFCLSQSLNSHLYNEFESDVCIEITDTDEFIRRVLIAVKRLISLHKIGLLHAPVSYYAPNEPAEFNIKDPKELVFAKDNAFLSKDLSRIRKDVPLNLCLKDYEWKDYNTKKVKEMLEEYGFKSLVKKIPGAEEEVGTGGNLKLW